MRRRRSRPPKRRRSASLSATPGRTFPPPAPLIDGLLSGDGGGWISGEEKLGKSWWALAETLGLALGKSIAGRFAVAVPRRVLFLEEKDPPRRAPRFGAAEALRVFAQIRSDRRIVTMIVLGGATSFFVGNAFQAQMPQYAHRLGSNAAGAGYSVLLAANAVGAVVGAVLLESLNLLRPNARTAIACAAAWGVTIGLFPLARTYELAVALLVLAGLFNIAFTSMAQTLVQILAPPRLRGSVVGLFNTAILGLRAGSGVTVGVLGAVISVQWSLALSAAAVVLIAVAMLVRESGAVSTAERPHFAE